MWDLAFLAFLVAWGLVASRMYSFCLGLLGSYCMGPWRLCFWASAR